MAHFDPNPASFEEGIHRVKEALRETQTQVSEKIVTSQDKGMAKVLNLLATDTAPSGFKKWQLPFIFDRAQLFISVGNPDTAVPNHSHQDGDGIRFIISGSIFYKDKELKSGDWMFIPKGVPYEMKIGPMGATMCYCYACCCAGKKLNRGADVINPNPFVKG